MLNITLPLWVLLVSVGVPFVSLMALIMALLRAKSVRRRSRRQSQAEGHGQAFGLSPVGFNGDMYKTLLDQQIDAVFMSLTTIIETEKIKLKALVTSQRPMLPLEPAPTADPLPASTKDDRDDGVFIDSAPANDLAGQVRALTEKGLSPKEIARDLGLSLSEVVLALRLNNSTPSANGLGGKLEAVA